MGGITSYNAKSKKTAESKADLYSVVRKERKASEMRALKRGLSNRRNYDFVNKQFDPSLPLETAGSKNSHAPQKIN